MTFKYKRWCLNIAHHFLLFPRNQPWRRLISISLIADEQELQVLCVVSLLIREVPRETSCVQLNLSHVAEIQLLGSRLPGFLLRPLSLPAEIQGGQYLISPVGEEEGSSVHVSDFLDQKGKFFV